MASYSPPDELSAIIGSGRTPGAGEVARASLGAGIPGPAARSAGRPASAQRPAHGYTRDRPYGFTGRTALYNMREFVRDLRPGDFYINHDGVVAGPVTQAALDHVNDELRRRSATAHQPR